VTRRAALALFAVFASSCTSAQAAAFVPRLVLRGGASRHELEAGERWSWRLEADAGWELDRPAPPLGRARLPKWDHAAESREVPCTAQSLCTWERRSVMRATERALERLRSER
jgi:hypothetical protein